MSKRRNRKQISKPNLSEETLARARREAGMEAEEIEEAEEEVVEAVAPPKPAPRETAPRSSVEAAPLAPRRARRKERAADPSQMTQAEIADRLANPTRTVSEEQLRTQYSYVIADLTSMGILAAALGIAMIVIARFL